MLPVLLRSYGDIMYQRGGALSNLRPLLLACQRWKPTCRPYMHQCWELVARWEAHQPVQHRTPLGEGPLCFGLGAWLVLLSACHSH